MVEIDKEIVGQNLHDQLNMRKVCEKMVYKILPLEKNVIIINSVQYYASNESKSSQISLIMSLLVTKLGFFNMILK